MMKQTKGGRGVPVRNVTLRHKPKRKPLSKRPFVKFVLFSTLFIGLAVLLMASPLFNITKITVKGNTTVEESYILGQGGIVNDMNIFMLNEGHVFDKLKSNPYIKSVKIDKNYPNSITVNVAERKLRGFIENKGIGSFLHIDETGTVINVTNAVTEKKPIITGLSYIDFAIGKPLKFDNPSAFEDIVILDKLFEKYEIDNVLGIDISTPGDIHLKIRGIDVSIGAITDADLKIRRLQPLLAEIPAEYTGSLDLSDVSGDSHVFTYYAK